MQNQDYHQTVSPGITYSIAISLPIDDMDDEGLYAMPACSHEVLTLMPPPGARLRCRHCHLTITAQELGSGCCPECLEVYKVQASRL